MAREFDPNEHNVDEVLAELDKAGDEERQRILNAERTGKARKTVLEEYGVDPDERRDASGRVLYPWEVTPEEHPEPETREFTDAERRAEEQRGQAPQGGASPAGTGTTGGAPAGGATTTGGAAGTAGTAV